jgi:hypothetical protein
MLPRMFRGLSSTVFLELTANDIWRGLRGRYMQGQLFFANNLATAVHRGSSERVAPDGATEDGVVIPVSNGAICSPLQDRCW